MSKLGLNVRIDVTKIDKARLFKGEKGTYLDLTTFIDLSQVDQYGNNGFISQATTKDERQAGVQTPILGNVKVFFNDAQQGQQQARQQQQSHQQSQPQQGFAPQMNNDYDDSIPF